MDTRQTTTERWPFAIVLFVLLATIPFPSGCEQEQLKSCRLYKTRKLNHWENLNETMFPVMYGRWMMFRHVCRHFSSMMFRIRSLSVTFLVKGFPSVQSQKIGGSSFLLRLGSPSGRGIEGNRVEAAAVLFWGYKETHLPFAAKGIYWTYCGRTKSYG